MGYLEQIEHIGEYVRENFALLNEEQLNWKPRPHKWSIAQCLEHLINSNSKYFPAFEKLLQEGYHPSPWQSISPLSEMWGKKLLELTTSIPTKKIKSPSMFAPSRSTIDAGIIQRFLEHQQQLLQYLKQLKPISKQNKIIISSAVSSLITFDLRTAMKAVAQHEQRHLNQANNVLHHAQFPK
ncbi:MAG: DinB family protein [Parafilimonas sp.]